MKKTTLTIAILLLITLIGLVPYCYLFRNGLELNLELFSSLGSYISGIAGILNLCVFVYLTNLVAKYEDNKSLNEIKVQKSITQTHFRQVELDKLISELEKPFENEEGEFTPAIIGKICKASIYLTNFLNQKQYLFPIMQNQVNLEVGNEINILFVKMIEQIESPTKDAEKSEKLFEDIHLIKNNFIHLLQKFIIEELEK